MTTRTQAHLSTHALSLSSWDTSLESCDLASLSFLICQMDALSALQGGFVSTHASNTPPGSGLYFSSEGRSVCGYPVCTFHLQGGVSESQEASEPSSHMAVTCCEGV